MLLLHVFKYKKSLSWEGENHTLPPLGRLTPSDDGASRRHIFDSYENTDFWAKILIFRCKNTENGKSNLAALFTLPQTKNPVITLTLTLCCRRYHRRSNCRRS